MKKEYSSGIRTNVFFAGLVSFFMDISSEMIFPLVPLFLTNVLGVNKSLVGLIEGVAESTASLTRGLSGWISDRTGHRKHLMIIGYAISTLSRPILATASIWPQIIASRFSDRLGKGIRTAPRDTLIAESTALTHIARAFGFHRSMDTLGAVVGPALSLPLLVFFDNNYRTVFWFSAVPGVIAVLLIFVFIKETKHLPPSHAPRPKMSLKYFDRRTRLFFLIATLFALGNSSDVFLILRAEHAGIPAMTIPAVYLMFNLSYALAAIPAGMAADRFGTGTILLSGFILFFLLYCGFAVVNTVSGIWMLFGFYGIFMGLTEGIQKAFLATIIPQDFKATGFGIYSTCVGLATLPGNLIAGILWDHVSPAATFYFGAATAAGSALLFAALVIRSKGSS